MKIARFVLKVVAAALALAAMVCCVIAFWDKIMENLGCAREKLATARGRCRCGSEYEDYADWDEE